MKHVYAAAAPFDATRRQPLLARIADTIQLDREKNVCKCSKPDRCVCFFFGGGGGGACVFVTMNKKCHTNCKHDKRYRRYFK